MANPKNFYIANVFGLESYTDLRHMGATGYSIVSQSCVTFVCLFVSKSAHLHAKVLRLQHG